MAREKRSKALNILLVEDNASWRFLLADFLHRAGANVLACESLREAVAHLVGFRPDITITDINLLDGTGFEVLAEIQKHDLKRGTATPVLAISASADIQLPIRLAHAGFIDFLRKPFPPQRLLESIVTALHRDPDGRSFLEPT
jgi:DNA-binding response OmpR family regulator